jgi:hypothetical protein
MSNTAITQIATFLATHKQPIRRPATKWTPIHWENQRRDVHIAYVKLVQRLELNQPKQLSIAACDHLIEYFKQLDAPEILYAQYVSNKANLLIGKGRQEYIEQLYNKSVKLARMDLL